MHNKNNNKSSTFMQGLRPFSNSIPKTLKKHLKKNGYNYSNIVDNWTRMVSKKISDACYPVTVKMGKEMKDSTLVLNVIHGKELEVEYEKNQIIDKISNVTLKTVRDKVVKNRKSFPKLKNINKIEEKINKVNDNQLKGSLNSLLKAYNERNR